MYAYGHVTQMPQVLGSNPRGRTSRHVGVQQPNQPARLKTTHRNRVAERRNDRDRPLGITGYTTLMAKVMVSLPDDLLKAVDIEAQRRGTTRSGLLRKLAEESLRRRTIQRAARMAQIDDLDGPVTGHGGGVAELVKANRPKN